MYEELHQKFFESLMNSIAYHLKAAGIEESKLNQVAEQLAFDIFSTIDGSAAIETNGSFYQPKISFKEECEETKEIEGNSFFHELVAGYFDDLDSKTEKEKSVNDELMGIVAAVKAFGGINLQNPDKQMAVLEDIQSALEPVKEKYDLTVNNITVMALTKSLVQEITCDKCGKYDPFNPHNDPDLC